MMGAVSGGQKNVDASNDRIAAGAVTCHNRSVEYALSAGSVV
jgi:hypothetical protein